MLTESDLRRARMHGEIYGPSTLDDPDGIMAYSAPTRRVAWRPLAAVVVPLALVALAVV